LRPNSTYVYFYWPPIHLQIFRIVSVTVTLDEGIYYIWVGQQNWDILNCEDENSAYWMSLVCSPVNEDSPAVMRKKDDFDISLLRKEK